MPDSVIPEEPPDENEQYESIDEGLDAEDAVGQGPEGERDLDSDLPVDEVELEEAGANLDDPDEFQPMLSGAMDDPDDPDPDAEEDDYDLGEEVPDDAPGTGGTAAEVVDTAHPAAEDDRTSIQDAERIPNDAPGVDSARW